MNFYIILLSLITFGCYIIRNCNTNEDFISGAQVQLLTSKPYYTMYDYLSKDRYRYPYNYWYPRYWYPRYWHPRYWYPYYKPSLY